MSPIAHTKSNRSINLLRSSGDEWRNNDKNMARQLWVVATVTGRGFDSEVLGAGRRQHVRLLLYRERPRTARYTCIRRSNMSENTNFMVTRANELEEREKVVVRRP